MAAMLVERSPAGAFNGALELGAPLSDPLEHAGGEGARPAIGMGSPSRRVLREDCANPLAQENSSRTKSTRTARAKRRAEYISSSPARTCNAPQTVFQEGFLVAAGRGGATNG